MTSARYRRVASEVEAIHLDGGEAAFRAVLAIPKATVARRPDGVEIVTAFGRRIARTGQWITRDVATGALRVEDAGDFAAHHEPM